MLHTPEIPFYNEPAEILPPINPIGSLREYLLYVNNMHIGTPERESLWDAHRRTADAYGEDVLYGIRKAGIAEVDSTPSLEVSDFTTGTTPHDIAAYYQALYFGRTRLEEMAQAETNEVTGADDEHTRRLPRALRIAGYAIRRTAMRTIS